MHVPRVGQLQHYFILLIALFISNCGLFDEPTTSVTCVSGCSSGTTAGEETTTGSPQVGVFVDSAVAGVTYTTSSGLSGTTNSSGEFDYQEGDNANFSIGDISLGSVTASAVLTPVEVMGASGTADQQVINLARLLQTLDSDGDPSNGIEITTSTSNSLKGKSLNFNVPVDIFTNDSTIAQIQSDVGRSLVSATSALNHLHTTLSERSLNSKISSDSKIQGLSTNLSSFSFTPTNTLVGASTARLRTTLEGLGTLSESQVSTIINEGSAQLGSDGLSTSESPSTALPSFLAGAMTGIGQASLNNDNLTNQVISQTIGVTTGIIGRFEDQLTSTSRSGRSTDGKAAFENLLGNLMGTAVDGLSRTGLDNESLDEGFGEIVGAMVSALDEAKTDAADMGTAVQAVTKKAVQKSASVPGLDTSAAIKATTKNAVKGLGKTKMAAADVSATLNLAVETVINSLDEIEGGSTDNISGLVNDVTSASVDGLADLQQDLAEDNSFDVSQAVSQITKGATKGAGALAAADSSFDLAGAIGSVSKSAAANLGKLTNDPALAAKMVSSVASGSMEGLANLKENFADNATVLTNAFKEVTKGTTAGAGALAAADKNFNLANAIGDLSKTAVSNLGKVTSDLVAMNQLIEGITSEITSAVAEMAAENPDLVIDTEAIEQQASAGVTEGQSAIPASCWLSFLGESIPGYGADDESSNLELFLTSSVPPGAACKSVVRTCNDGELLGDPLYLFPTCYAASTIDNATVALGEEDFKMPSSWITLEDVLVTEEAGRVLVPLTLSADMPGGLTVFVSTEDISAEAGTDYTALRGKSVSFAGSAGEIQRVVIQLQDDKVVESPESFWVKLVDADDETVDILDKALVTICDGDGDGDNATCPFFLPLEEHSPEST